MMETVTPHTGVDATPGGPPATTAATTATGAGRRRARRIALLAGVPLLVAALAAGAYVLFRPHAYAGTVMQAPTPAPAMDALIGTDGRPVDLTAYRGDVVVLFFGYTHCPDVCPTTMSVVGRTLDRLGDDADRVRVLMVSVDPERDDAATLRDYVQAFDPTFMGATGDLAAVERVAAEYGIFFARGEALGDGYTVDHTASLMAIDPEGKLRIVWPNSVPADALASDLRELL